MKPFQSKPRERQAVADYIAERGKFCPWCGDNDMRWTSHHFDTAEIADLRDTPLRWRDQDAHNTPTALQLTLTCNTCDGTWFEIYILAAFEFGEPGIDCAEDDDDIDEC